MGVGGTYPHPDRGMPSLAVKRGREIFLFDCGEGSQTSFIAAGLGVNRPLKIFITHLHGDHVYGLPPLLYTLSLLGRSEPLEIYGPPGLAEFLRTSLLCGGRGLTYEVKVNEVRLCSTHVIVDSDEYVVRAGPAHHTITSFFYVFEEKPRPGRFNVEQAEKLGIPPGPLRKRLQKGFSVKLPSGRVVHPWEVLAPPRPGIKVVYSGDTRPSKVLISAAKMADVLIHDATFSGDLEADALEKGHSTAKEAGEVALLSKSKVLFLFHYSQRYKDLSVLLREAREYHRITYLSKRGQRVTIIKKDVMLTLLFGSFNKVPRKTHMVAGSASGGSRATPATG